MPACLSGHTSPTEIVLAHQGFTTEFEQNALVSGLGF